MHAGCWHHMSAHAAVATHAGLLTLTVTLKKVLVLLLAAAALLASSSRFLAASTSGSSPFCKQDALNHGGMQCRAGSGICVWISYR